MAMIDGMLLISSVWTRFDPLKNPITHNFDFTSRLSLL